MSHIPFTATKEDLLSLCPNPKAVKNLSFKYLRNFQFSGNCYLEFFTRKEAENFYSKYKKSRPGVKSLFVKFISPPGSNLKLSPVQIGPAPEKVVVAYGFPKSAKVELISSSFPEFEFVNTAAAPVLEYKYYDIDIKEGMKKTFIFHFATQSEAHRFVRTYNQTYFMPKYNGKNNLLDIWNLM
ncbi:hypothetical protein AYI68_g552 [Smittium mucronatum]|uniref:Uncharacterized protein n=1 Tax=Smittium mucronatum TaxID=133383 RepID=A0A1R0H853_9FUNG|nr:hypothetical protein AYI68_g552 [Smittium mucronatum]